MYPSSRQDELYISDVIVDPYNEIKGSPGIFGSHCHLFLNDLSKLSHLLTMMDPR